MDSDELFADFLACVDAGQAIHAVVLAERLLKVCRADGNELRKLLENPDTCVYCNSITNQTRRLFEDARGVFLTTPVLERLALLVDGGVREHGRALTARAVAVALDQQFGSVFHEYFARRSRLLLQPNTAFPVSQSRNHALVRKPASGNPAIRRSAHDELQYLRLAPANLQGLEVELLFCERDLPELTPHTTFGFGVVSNGIAGEYEKDDYLAPEPVFFGVRPRDLEGHRQRLKWVVANIQRLRPDVVVLPELSLTEALLEELLREGALQDVPLLVLGSRHCPSDRRGGSNAASVFARGKLLYEHRKFRPVDFGKPSRREHLVELTPRLTILSSSRLSVGVAICKDAIDPAVGATWKHVGTNLVLVPAMSEDTHDFSDLAHNMGADPQAFTCVANTGGKSVLFGRPSLDSRVILLDSESPGLVHLDVNGECVVNKK